jgi:hypothetical protein
MRRQKLDQTSRQDARLRWRPSLAIRFPYLRGEAVYRLSLRKLCQASCLLPGINVLTCEQGQDAQCHLICLGKRSKQESVILGFETRKCGHVASHSRRRCLVAVALTGRPASCEFSARSDKRKILTVHIYKIDRRFARTFGGAAFFPVRSATLRDFAAKRVIFGGSLAGNVPSSSSSSWRSSSRFSRCEGVSFAVIGISPSIFIHLVPYDCALVRCRSLDSTLDLKRRSVTGHPAPKLDGNHEGGIQGC